MYNSGRLPDPTNRAANKLRRQADSWRYNPAMERLRAMKDSNPNQYDLMGPVVHLSLGHYEADKECAARLGYDVSAPTDSEV